MEHVTVEADYHRSAEGWSTTLTAPQLGMRTLSGADLPAVFAAVLDAATDTAGRLGRTCQTVHRLDTEGSTTGAGTGSAAELAALAAQQGFVPGPGPVVTVSGPAATESRETPKARCPYRPA